ncbi:hypothetical protein KTS45_13505 [Halomicroarcula limicola]|uniref:ParB/Sulfiredoxin domain-containing protein n=1 Tax=Haloarcula limicola TaxID=1429915 RepID=A0A8J7YAU5_9EURY|nr:hypothetical protein [Halomicroarcula limicola]MBV0925216.1 hypothetical protein [Halomicroarcula limicola]
MSLLTKSIDKFRRDGLSGLTIGGVYFGRQKMRNQIGKITYRYYHCGQTDADDDRILWIDPRTIKYAFADRLSSQEYGRHFEIAHRSACHQYAEFGDILTGDWDRQRVPITEYTEWKLIMSMIDEKIPFEQTKYYNACLDRFQRGAEIWGCQSEAELKERIKYLDHLKQSINSDGYKRNNEPDGAIGTESLGPSTHDEITVDIGRDGTFLHFTNGRHRLAIAYLCNIPKIPVLVRVRHEQWQAIRDEFRQRRSLSDLSEQARKFVGHPDLEDLIS